MNTPIANNRFALRTLFDNLLFQWCSAYGTPGLEFDYHRVFEDLGYYAWGYVQNITTYWERDRRKKEVKELEDAHFEFQRAAQRLGKAIDAVNKLPRVK